MSRWQLQPLIIALLYYKSSSYVLLYQQHVTQYTIMTDSYYLISNQNTSCIIHQPTWYRNNSQCTIVFGHEFEGERMCLRATWVKRKLVRVVGWALDFHRNSYEVKRSRVAVWAAHSQSSPKNSNKRLSEKGIGWMGEQGTLKLQRKRKKEYVIT